MSITRDMNISNQWSKIADASDQEVIVGCNYDVSVGFSTGSVTETDTGHVIKFSSEKPKIINRYLFGSGDVYAKCINTNSTRIVVTRSSEVDEFYLPDIENTRTYSQYPPPNPEDLSYWVSSETGQQFIYLEEANVWLQIAGIF